MAHAGTFISLLDGPRECYPAFHILLSRFRHLRRYLADRPGEIFRAYALLDAISECGPGHGPIHLLLLSAPQLGWTWDSTLHLWSRPGLICLHVLAGPHQHDIDAVRSTWISQVGRRLCKRRFF